MNSMLARPRLRQEIALRQVEQEYVAYDPNADRVTLLNASAIVLLELCDGQRTVAELAEAFAEAFSLSSDLARDDVQSALRRLSSLGLLD